MNKLRFGKKGIYLILTIVSILFFMSLVSSRQIDCIMDKPTQLWHFEEGNGTIATDSCNGYNATFNGDMVWSDGVYGKSVGFNGANTYLDAGNIYPFNQNMPEFSFSLWVNISSQLVWQSIFRSGYYNPYSEFMELIQINDGLSDFVLFMGASSLGINIIDDSNWHNIIGTFNGTSQISTLYIDGVYVTNYSIGISEVTATTVPLYFGFNFDNGFLTNGTLDEVAFFNRTLIPEEAMDIFRERTPNNLSLVLYLTDYPFVEVNTNYTIRARLLKNMTGIIDANMIISIGNLSGSHSDITLIYNPSTQYYETTVLFNETINYDFLLEANSFIEGYANTTGTFLVRSPFYATFEIYKGKTNSSRSHYKNDFGYVTVEYLTRPLNAESENYFYPFNVLHTSVFHAPYIGGQATVKLWDSPTNYAIRFLDGNIYFPSSYSVPNVTKSYGTNLFLGTLKLNGTDSTYQYLLKPKEFHAWSSILNICMVLLLVIAVFVGIGLLIAYPQVPVLALATAFLFAIVIIIGRIYVYLAWSI